MPVLNEIENIYPIECQIGNKALEMIERATGTKLYPSEAAAIALSTWLITNPIQIFQVKVITIKHLKRA